MLNKVVEVKVGGKRIYLVGTAHVSDESVELIEKTIEEVKPDLVAVELCEQRQQAIKEKKRWSETEITEVIKSGKIYLFLTQLLLSNFQRKIGEDVGVKAGSDMIKAVEISREKGIEVALVDRDIKITLRRALNTMSLIEKFKILLAFLTDLVAGVEVDKELIEKLKEKDLLSELMDELSREAPSVKKVLVDERDEYIASKILDGKAKKIVAVVGAGHIKGIHKMLESGKTTPVKSLETVPESRNYLKIVGYLFVVAFIVLLAAGFWTGGTRLAFEMFASWFLINGVLSALGVALALGHPITILTAFLAAPFTSMNPTIAAGWVAGLVELKLMKPRVMDFENLMKLSRIRDYWGNRVTRVILVIAFANLGSSLGTYIAIPYIASLL